MKYLLFGGQSLSNKAWMTGMSAALGGVKHAAVTMHEYAAWDGQPDEDDKKQYGLELALAKLDAQKVNADVIIGKSYGSIIALQCKAVVDLLVVIGPPTNVSDKLLGVNMLDEMRHSQASILILTNKDDKMVNTQALLALAKAQPNKVQLCFTEGSGHEYVDYDSYAQLVRDNLSKR